MLNWRFTCADDGAAAAVSAAAAVFWNVSADSVRARTGQWSGGGRQSTQRRREWRRWIYAGNSRVRLTVRRKKHDDDDGKNARARETIWTWTERGCVRASSAANSWRMNDTTTKQHARRGGKSSALGRRRPSGEEEGAVRGGCLSARDVSGLVGGRMRERTPWNVNNNRRERRMTCCCPTPRRSWALLAALRRRAVDPADDARQSIACASVSGGGGGEPLPSPLVTDDYVFLSSVRRSVTELLARFNMRRCNNNNNNNTDGPTRPENNRTVRNSNNVENVSDGKKCRAVVPPPRPTRTLEWGYGDTIHTGGVREVTIGGISPLYWAFFFLFI